MSNAHPGLTSTRLLAKSIPQTSSAEMHASPQALLIESVLPKALPHTLHDPQPRAAHFASGTMMSEMISGTSLLAAVCMSLRIGAMRPPMLDSQLPPSAGASKSTIPMHLIWLLTVYLPREHWVHVEAPKPYWLSFVKRLFIAPVTSTALSVSLPAGHPSHATRGSALV